MSWYPTFKFHCLLLTQPSLKLTSIFLPQRSPPEGTKISPYPCPQNTNGKARAVTDLIRPVPLTAPLPPPVSIIRQFVNPVPSLWTQPEHLNSSDAHTEVVKPQRHDRGVSGFHSGVVWGAKAVMLGHWFPRRFDGWKYDDSKCQNQSADTGSHLRRCHCLSLTVIVCTVCSGLPICNALQTIAFTSTVSSYVHCQSAHPPPPPAFF